MEVRLLSHQREALFSNHKATALVSGIGGGKTWTGVHWVIKMSQEYPKSLGFIGANTFSQLRNSTLSAVFNELMNLNIPFSYNQSSGILTVLGKRWLCKSMDNYDPLRGIEVGEIWLDECAYMKEEAYNVIMGRLRDKFGALKVFLTTTPKGFNWLYQKFHENGDDKTDENFLIHAVSSENLFLPDGYLDTIRGQYDEKLLAQELGGEFINVTSGSIYYAFSRVAHVKDIEINERFPLWAGVDFNVNPMTATIGQVINDILYVVDEFYLKNSNTEALCKNIISKYGDGVTIVPDSTGKKMTTNANVSDLQILQRYFKNVRVAGNPFRVDRYAAVNGAFSNGKVVISPRCKYTIKDLESVVYKKGTDKPDTSDKMLTHCSDNLGYLIYRTVNPLFNRNSKIQSFKR